MKRFVALLLLLALCLCLMGCGKKDETHEYILSLLEQGEYDMAIHVIEGLRDMGSAPAPESSTAAAEDESQRFELEPECTGSDWLFHMDLINHTDSRLTLEAVLIRDFTDDVETGCSEFSGQDLQRLPMGALELESGMGIGWDDAHPMVDFFNRREYLHIFRNEQGERVDISYLFDMCGMMPQGPVDNAAPQGDGEWYFTMLLENPSKIRWHLHSVDVTNLIDGEPLETTTFENKDFSRLGLSDLTLLPGQSLDWSDAHPIVSDWNGREYRFHFKDQSGETHTLKFRFVDPPVRATVDYSADPGKDLVTLRHDASFEVELYPGVFWVPANSLGLSRYSNADIHGMLSASPEEKQQNISILYEALQLFQIGNFLPSSDNVRIFENGIDWEHHKPGYHAVRTNTGCCATVSNWLRYILDGDYEDVGFLATSERNGSGHVYNYILQDGWYYFIDLTHYCAYDPSMTAEETGKLSSYRNSDIILGNIHKTKDVQSYVDYMQQSSSNFPGLIFMYSAENVLAIDSLRLEDGIDIVYEEANGQEITVVFDDSTDSLGYRREKSPLKLPDWANLP